MHRPRTAFVILGMLTVQDPLSGYDLRKAIESSVGHFWGESYGQIYPTLKSLAAEGLIVPSPGPVKQRRQAYSITAAGRDALQQWLALPFTNDPPRNEFLLKLFFGREAPAGATAAHLVELNRRNRSSLEQLEQIQSLAPKLNAGNPHLPYWLMTLGLGIAMTRAALEWGERTLLELESPAPDAETQPVTRPTA